MDPHRFDHLSKAFARRLSRRGILAGLGAGTVFAPSPTAASGAATCVYDFDATIDVGPSSTIAQTNAVAGELTITVAANGAIATGKLTLTDGTVWTAVGQATGRAINLRFSVPNTGAFIAVGVGRHDIATCPSAMAGPASGPLRKDAGSWSATFKPAAANPTPSATAPVVTEPSGATQPTDAATAAPTEEPTAEPSEAPTTPATIEPTTASGDCQLTCAADALLDASSCSCVCANGLTHCLHSAGGADEVLCVDVTSDLNNCGTCGTVCAGIQYDADPVCTNGTCNIVCLRGLVTCNPDAPCKTFLDADNAHCGACGNVCGGATPTCVNSVCVCTADTTSDRTNCGACGVVCPPFAAICTEGTCSAPAHA